MASIQQRLVELLLAEPGGARRAASALSGEKQWPDAVALARSWKVTPRVLARVRELSAEPPAAVSASLRHAFMQAYGSSAQRARQAIVALDVLGAAGIPVVAFKGVATMALLYGDPRERTIYDADLLVLPDHFTAAVRCLEQGGYTRQGSETLDQYADFVGNAPGFAGNKAITLFGAGGCEIDLHWDLGGLGIDPQAMLGRARRAALLGSMIPVADPADGFLLTVHHAIRENLAIDSVARDLLDIRLWCERLREEPDAVMDRFAEAGYQAPALAVTSLLAEYDPAGAAAVFAARWMQSTGPAEQRSAARLRELFRHQLEHGRLEKDVFYLVHSRPWRQILRGLGTDWSGYRNSMETVEAQLGQQRPLYERAAGLAKSVPGLRTLKLARELARIKYGIRRTPPG